jgi:type I restriction enzyme S subunit
VTSNWQWLTLDDVLTPLPNRKKVQQGWSPKCYDTPAPPGEWGVLKTTAIQAGRFEPEHNKALPEHLDPKPGIEVTAGDLLITCAGPRSRCGVPALVRSTPKRLMMSGKMYRFRPDNRLDSRFLELWLLSPDAQRQIDAIKTGISDSGLNLTHARFTRLPVPVPPLAEQRHIVELLEDHLSRLDAAEGYLSSGLRRAEVWYGRLLADTLWAAEYPRVQVQDLLREPMRNGRSDRAAAGAEHGTRTLTLTAVTKNAFTEANTKMTVTPTERARGLWLEPGDVFVQRSNTPELVGTTARYDGPREWAIFPDLLIRLRADESKVDSRFLAAALQSKPGHDQLRRKAKGLAGSMPKIDQNAIATATIPVPSLDDQLRLLDAIRDAADARNLVRTELALAQRRSQGLRRALLGAAFSGRLTGDASDLSEAEEMIGA